MSSPTQAGFIVFIRTKMQINTTVLPDNSADITEAYNVAIDVVNQLIACASAVMYTNAVYNYAGDYLINNATDQSNQTYFKNLRINYNINAFTAGVIAESHDETTGQTVKNPKAMESLTFGDLQLTKTPFGLAYLAIAQRVGTLWGVS